MFKIGEFSKLTQVSIRMLRYYDETGLLIPAKIDRFTNYRLYSADQISTLNKIVFLRDLGFHISEIAVALNNWDNEHITKILEDKRLEIECVIAKEQEKVSKIEHAKKDILREKITLNYSVSIKAIPGYHVLSIRQIVPSYYSEGQLWEEMSIFVKQHNISILNNPFTIYHDTDYREKNVDIELCAPVACMGEDSNRFSYRFIEPVPIMACTIVYGAFEHIAESFSSFANWLQEHEQYNMTGQSRQIVHRGPWNEENPDKYLTEIQIPLEKS